MSQHSRLASSTEFDKFYKELREKEDAISIAYNNQCIKIKREYDEKRNVAYFQYQEKLIKFKKDNPDLVVWKVLELDWGKNYIITSIRLNEDTRYYQDFQKLEKDVLKNIPDHQLHMIQD